MKHDISKVTIMILLVLTILVSALGTWTVMANLKSGPVVQKQTSQTYQGSNSAKGEVSLIIGVPPSAAGQVILNIQKSNN